MALGRRVRQRLAGTVVFRDVLSHSAAVLTEDVDLTASGLLNAIGDPLADPPPPYCAVRPPSITNSDPVT